MIAPPLHLSVLLGWALVATLGIVLRAQGVLCADGMLVTGFSGYLAFAIHLLLGRYNRVQ